jgi:hypothetical protein
MSHDEKCYFLATYFLADQLNHTEKDRLDLADEIQQTIETFIEQRFPISSTIRA